MQVHLHFKDTVTSEDDFALVYVNEFTGESVRQALEARFSSQTQGDHDGFALESWVVDHKQNTAVFVLRELGRHSTAGYLLYGTAFHDS